MKPVFKFKYTVMLISVTFILLSFTALRPQSAMFGKTYLTSKDFTCCKNGKLTVHHFWLKNIFWVATESGYDEEQLNRIDEGCILICED
jgi:hypothetical protein